MITNTCIKEWQKYYIFLQVKNQCTANKIPLVDSEVKVLRQNNFLYLLFFYT